MIFEMTKTKITAEILVALMLISNSRKYSITQYGIYHALKIL